MKRSSKLALALASALVSFGTTEVAVRAAGLFADARAATREHALAREDQGSQADKLFLPHPFLAYAGNPEYRDKLIEDVALGRMFPGEPSEFYLHNSRFNQQGFPSQHADYLALEDGFRIAIFGGSVAEQLATVGGEVLIAEVERRFPELHGRVQVLNFALGGYKQPQQLINLILMGLQGVKLDVVVNLDGFNEVALSGADMANGYYPLLPSRRHYFMMLKLSPESLSAGVIETYAEALRLRRGAERWRGIANRPVLARSELVRALCGTVVVRRLDRADTIEHELEREDYFPKELLKYRAPCFGNPDHCWELIADIWEESSLEMDAVARLNGAQYLHFLQPNQYVEGSKPLTERERKLAYTPEIDWAKGVRKAYPLLKQRTEGMRARGVVVHDLTGLFSAVTEDVYIDTCCHYNRLGTGLVAAAIAERVQGDGSAPDGE